LGALRRRRNAEPVALPSPLRPYRSTDYVSEGQAMRKPRARMEGWVLITRDDVPWFLTGYATGHPKLPGFRRFIHSSEIQKIDAQRGYAETLNTLYILRYRLEDIAIDDDGFIRKARIRDVVARRGDIAGEWLLSRGNEVVDRIWGIPFYELVPKMLSLVSRLPRN
jgi:hypothetical protein